MYLDLVYQVLCFLVSINEMDQEIKKEMDARREQLKVEAQAVSEGK